MTTSDIAHRKAPLVSIVMPTYNQVAYIEAAITSILSQTFCDFELIVVDDGSTDHTDAFMAENYMESRLTFYHRPHAGDYGISAINYGFEQARGKYLTWVSSDNIYLGTFVRTLVEALEYSTASIAYADFMNLYEDGDLKETRRPPHVNGGFQPVHLTIGYTLGIAFMYTRDIWEKTGPYHKTPYGDFDWTQRAIGEGATVYYVPQYVAINRIHAKQASESQADWADHMRIRGLATDHIQETQGIRLLSLEERVK